MDEVKRLAALHDIDILVGPREPALDQIARLAQLAFGAQHAGIMMVDRSVATFVARANIKAKSVPRDEAFCNIAIRGQDPLIIPDTSLDPRVASNPNVALGVRSYAGVPLATRDGYNIGTLCVFGTAQMDFAPDKVQFLQELAKLAMYCIELRRNAVQDHLTGALNRRGFMAEMGRALERYTWEKRDMALVLMDLDHFKKVNDRFGHPAGDLVLQRVVELAMEHCRETDLVGRLGGEEFAILLPGLTEQAAFGTVEQLRLAIQAMELPEVPDLRVTASFGIAEAGPFAARSAALMAKADAALYNAKAGSRNRTELAQGRPDEIFDRDHALGARGGAPTPTLDDAGDTRSGFAERAPAHDSAGDAARPRNPEKVGPVGAAARAIAARPSRTLD